MPDLKIGFYFFLFFWGHQQGFFALPETSACSEFFRALRNNPVFFLNIWDIKLCIVCYWVFLEWFRGFIIAFRLKWQEMWPIYFKVCNTFECSETSCLCWYFLCFFSKLSRFLVLSSSCYLLLIFWRWRHVWLW